MIEEKFFTFSNFTRNSNSWLTPCEEDYIEMMYRIHLKSLPIKVNDLANKLNVKPPSVTKMMKKLSLKNIIYFERYREIILCNKGIEIGKFLIYRHDTIKKFLEILKANVDVNSETEKIEHTLSRETLEKINNLIVFFERNENVLKFFHDFSQSY